MTDKDFENLLSESMKAYGGDFFTDEYKPDTAVPEHTFPADFIDDIKVRTVNRKSILKIVRYASAAAAVFVVAAAAIWFIPQMLAHPSQNLTAPSSAYGTADAPNPADSYSKSEERQNNTTTEESSAERPAESPVYNNSADFDAKNDDGDEVSEETRAEPDKMQGEDTNTSIITSEAFVYAQYSNNQEVTYIIAEDNYGDIAEYLSEIMTEDNRVGSLQDMPGLTTEAIYLLIENHAEESIIINGQSYDALYMVTMPEGTAALVFDGEKFTEFYYGEERGYIFYNILYMTYDELTVAVTTDPDEASETDSDHAYSDIPDDDTSEE